MYSEYYLIIELNLRYIKYAIYKNSQSFLEHINIIEIPKEYGKNSRFVDSICEIIQLIMKRNKCTITNTRIYATSEFCSLEEEERFFIKNKLYVNIGININFLSKDLEEFYRNQSNRIKDIDSILSGVISKEYRKVVICGSFRKHLDIVKEVNNFCSSRGIKVLSPKSVAFKEIFNDSFVLFHGEKIENERETFLIEDQHTEAIKNADAIIVCNQDGYIGKTTLYEIGFARALNKSIIFLFKEDDSFDINFPKDYGLLGFDFNNK